MNDQIHDRILEARLVELDAKKTLAGCIQEVHRQKLWKTLGFRSLSEYCQKELNYEPIEARTLAVAVGAILIQDKMISQDPRTQIKIDTLKAWRKSKSLELNVPPFRILSNHLIMSIVQANPHSLPELEMIPGIGEKKLENFGNDILKCIRTIE